MYIFTATSVVESLLAANKKRGIAMSAQKYSAIIQVINGKKKSLPIVKDAVREAIKCKEELTGREPTDDIEKFIKKYGELYSEERSPRGMTVNQITDFVIRDIETNNLPS
jgi:hypothetical protein